jgi:hypothetical protein
MNYDFDGILLSTEYDQARAWIEHGPPEGRALRKRARIAVRLAEIRKRTFTTADFMVAT